MCIRDSYHSKTFALQCEARNSRKQQHYILFYKPVLTARPTVHAAMRCVEYDYGSRVYWNWRRNLLGACLC